MTAVVSLIGQRFGRLLVVGGPVPGRARTSWESVCDCGNKSINGSGVLKRGSAVSCGCFKRETTIATHTKHGMKWSVEYRAWEKLRHRCDNPKDKSFKNYGGRGITYAPEWNSFEQFFKDMGPRPAKHSIDRIDVNGNYEPNNCRWATAKQQARNLRKSVYIEAFGVRKTLPEWIEDQRCAVQNSTLRHRLSRGWSTESAISTPPTVVVKRSSKVGSTSRAPAANISGKGGQP